MKWTPLPHYLVLSSIPYFALPSILYLFSFVFVHFPHSSATLCQCSVPPHYICTCSVLHFPHSSPTLCSAVPPHYARPPFIPCLDSFPFEPYLRAAYLCLLLKCKLCLFQLSSFLSLPQLPDAPFQRNPPLLILSLRHFPFLTTFMSHKKCTEMCGYKMICILSNYMYICIYREIFSYKKAERGIYFISSLEKTIFRIMVRMSRNTQRSACGGASGRIQWKCGSRCWYQDQWSAALFRALDLSTISTPYFSSLQFLFVAYMNCNANICMYFFTTLLQELF